LQVKLYVLVSSDSLRKNLNNVNIIIRIKVNYSRPLEFPVEKSLRKKTTKDSELEFSKQEGGIERNCRKPCGFL